VSVETGGSHGVQEQVDATYDFIVTNLSGLQWL